MWGSAERRWLGAPRPAGGAAAKDGVPEHGFEVPRGGGRACEALNRTLVIISEVWAAVSGLPLFWRRRGMRVAHIFFDTALGGPTPDQRYRRVPHITRNSFILKIRVCGPFSRPAGGGLMAHLRGSSLGGIGREDGLASWARIQNRLPRGITMIADVWRPAAGVGP